ncbi:MAG: hypothetical protein JJT95_06045 [Pararhodobacter sp.]|nr:hypothetical protein [Pararhodobacter sp.]
MKISYQALADDITRKTKFPLEFEAGGKRVARFLVEKRRQPNDFIDAIARYLGSVPPPDIEQSAAVMAHFFSHKLPGPVDITELAGRYQAWASTDKRPETKDGAMEITILDGYEFKAPPPRPMASKMAYAEIEMKPMEKVDALMVSESVINSSLNPAIQSFADGRLPEQAGGIMVAFGESSRRVPRYIMATRTVMETRLHHLYRIGNDPLTLRGSMTFNGGVGRMFGTSHSDPLYPDYQIEMVRVADIGEG